MSSYVLDASAVLALLNSEPGSELVTQAVTAGAVMSTVNLSEVVAKLSDAGMIEEKVREVIDLLGIQFSDFDARAAYQAGVLRPQTRAAGLSLGDRACLALAKDLGIPAVTTDRAWAALPLGVTIRLARPPVAPKEPSDSSAT